MVAIKAVARELARACYHVMKDGKPFDVSASADPTQAKSSLRPYREPQGAGSHPCEATDLCGRLDWLRGLDAVGNRGVFWGCERSQGPVAAKRPSLDPDG
ncbi:hypothetical protein GCM10009107_47470 [Ideonella azotifigens]|uniref:Transposase n=1 Tax=Ideonella azotifigens TaxID=513160 RepID=A0ABN1KD16_9BURK